MKPIITGLSAIDNGYWQGIFYPDDLPRSQYFEYYCTQFNTFEINSTFYKFPTAKSLNTWYKKSPDDFMFALKAPKDITHLKRFIDCRKELDALYSVADLGLREKLTTVLFQCPPSLKYDPETLDLILKSMNPNFKNVVEFRHESWWIQNVFDAFLSAGVSFCTVSYPNLPDDFIATSDIGYVRLHGVPHLYYSEYLTSEMMKLHIQISVDDISKKVFVYFDNTASTAGILNAVEFKHI